MILQKMKIEKEPAPSTDWKVYGEIYDDNNVYVASFGETGTSVNTWWVTQDEEFQNDIVQQFSIIMALQIFEGKAE